MEVRRRGRSLFMEEKHYRFLTPHQTAQAAFVLRNLPEGTSMYQAGVIIQRHKGRKAV